MSPTRRDLLLTGSAALALGCAGGPPSPPPSDSTMDWKRIEREHWMNGEVQLLISHPQHMTPDEVAECPAGLISAFHAWPNALETLPASLEWVRANLRARKPVLERCLFNGDRVYWALRYVLHGDVERLRGACLGTQSGGLPSDREDTLGWLTRAFGHVNLCSEWSGGASWGMRLQEADNGEFLKHLPEVLPPQAKDWLALYEVDGDWLALDPLNDSVHWCGVEWTGRGDYPIAASANLTAAFVLWRMLDGGFLRPTDLDMLMGAKAQGAAQ